MTYKLIVPDNLIELNESIIFENNQHYWLGLASLRKHRIKKIKDMNEESKFTSIMVDRGTKEELKRVMIESGCKNYPELIRRMIFIMDRTKHLNFGN
ncbi:MAG: hypothetical protein LC127_05975 [Chitinophagales bacterium]|nr:hypothetical protein [Chitinophagales bacterium]